MTKPFSQFEQMLEELEDGGDSQEFWNARAEFVSAMWKASGCSQQEFASAISFSPAYAQKILTQGFAWGKKESAISEALGLPPGYLSTEKDTKEFLDLCPVFVISIDAIVNFKSVDMREAKLVPSIYIKEKITDSDLDEGARDQLLKYFTDPTSRPEPNDQIVLTKLEKLLGLPINAITNPDELKRTQSKASQLGVKTKKIIAKNVKAQMNRDNISAVELATRAGISEATLKKLIHFRQCTMTTLFSIASAFSLDPYRLMVNSAEVPAPATAEHAFQKKEYEDLPLVARAFLSEYLQLIREKVGSDEISEPTGKAASVLILTPILHYAIKLIEENANSIDSNTSMDLAGIMKNLERNLRVMTAPNGFVT